VVFQSPVRRIYLSVAGT